MMLSGAAPRTTRVVSLASPPRTASAARPVASLVVDAGVIGREPCSDIRTRPVAGSATTADTWGPSAAADSGPDSAARSPVAFGSGPSPGPVASTARPLATGSGATAGTRSAASRAGSMRATAMPAVRVKTLITASVSTAAIRVRRMT